jgi:hypothetical protein
VSFLRPVRRNGGGGRFAVGAARLSGEIDGNDAVVVPVRVVWEKKKWGRLDSVYGQLSVGWLTGLTGRFSSVNSTYGVDCL